MGCSSSQQTIEGLTKETELSKSDSNRSTSNPSEETQQPLPDAATGTDFDAIHATENPSSLLSQYSSPIRHSSIATETDLPKKDFENYTNTIKEDIIANTPESSKDDICSNNEIKSNDKKSSLLSVHTIHSCDPINEEESDITDEERMKEQQNAIKTRNKEFAKRLMQVEKGYIKAEQGRGTMAPSSDDKNSTNRGTMQGGGSDDKNKQQLVKTEHLNKLGRATLVINSNGPQRASFFTPQYDRKTAIHLANAEV